MRRELVGSRTRLARSRYGKNIFLKTSGLDGTRNATANQADLDHVRTAMKAGGVKPMLAELFRTVRELGKLVNRRNVPERAQALFGALCRLR